MFSYGWYREILRRRWCETISQYNLINYCLHPREKRVEKLYSKLGVIDFLDRRKYVKDLQYFNNDLRELIFSELKMKAEMADDLEIAKDLWLARGDWVLRLEGHTELLPWVSEVDFDESLLLWHVATEICRYSEGESGETDLHRKRRYREGESGEIDLYRKREEENKYRDIAKLLSEYMLYLLIFRSPIMSSVAGIGQIRFNDTCADAKKFFEEKKIIKAEETETNVWDAVKKWFGCDKKGEDVEKRKSSTGGEQKEKKKASNEGEHKENKKTSNGGEHKKNKKSSTEEEEEVLQKRACKSIFDVRTAFKPITIKGDSSKSVLFDACMLAKELEKIGKEKYKWEIISKVWVEMLSYAMLRINAGPIPMQLNWVREASSSLWSGC